MNIRRNNSKFFRHIILSYCSGLVEPAFFCLEAKWGRCEQKFCIDSVEKLWRITLRGLCNDTSFSMRGDQQGGCPSLLKRGGVGVGFQEESMFDVSAYKQ